MANKLKVANVCDDCLTAVYDEPGGHRLDGEQQAQMAIELGSEISDHNCWSVEDPDYECACGCNQRN